MEREYMFVKPSKIIVGQGELSKATGLKIAIDIEDVIAAAATATTPEEIYTDINEKEDSNHLHSILSAIPMFADELPLVEQAMADHENRIEKSPIVHPEIAGRGIE